MARKMMDCRESPSVSNCSLVIAGEEDEVVRAASEHAVSVHSEKRGPELQQRIRGMLKNSPAGL